MRMLGRLVAAVTQIRMFFHKKMRMLGRLVAAVTQIRMFFRICVTFLLRNHISGPPLWSSGQSSWLQTQKSRVLQVLCSLDTDSAVRHRAHVRQEVQISVETACLLICSLDTDSAVRHRAHVRQEVQISVETACLVFSELFHHSGMQM
jgi:tryptophan 2,3-dioxygenase